MVTPENADIRLGRPSSFRARLTRVSVSETEVGSRVCCAMLPTGYKTQVQLPVTGLSYIYTERPASIKATRESSSAEQVAHSESAVRCARGILVCALPFDI